MRRKEAFTLIELLVAIAIFSIILTLVMSALRTGSNALGVIVGEADIIEDARAASAIIADEIGQAAYVYPPGTVLTLNSSGSYTTENPNGGNQWTVGDDPIIAMITAPNAIFTPTDTCSNATTQFCYTFVAFYPVKRSTVVANRGYLADPPNDNGADAKWVLYEYRANLTNVDGNSIGPDPTDLVKHLNGEIPSTYGGITAQILVDYVIPDSLQVNIDEDDCYPGNLGSDTTGYFIGALNCSDVPAQDIYGSVAAGEFAFRSGRSKRGRDYRSPEISFAIAPLNLRNPLLDN
jgi:prepilin-type N-terminal cleavage/methylation domain-containing protein